jgi:hypothetical protein
VRRQALVQGRQEGGHGRLELLHRGVSALHPGVETAAAAAAAHEKKSPPHFPLLVRSLRSCWPSRGRQPQSDFSLSVCATPCVTTLPAKKKKKKKKK